MFQSAAEIRDALFRLGRKLALRDSEEYRLLVCGGSALNLLGNFSRATRDVDALAVVTRKGGRNNLEATPTLPVELQTAANEVAADLGLDPDWLNMAAAPLVAFGLPSRILQRAKLFQFGPCFTILSISRRDQIALKLYAALDRRNGHRHWEDLIRLKPTRLEIKFAVAWLLDRPTSPAFRRAVGDAISGLGFTQVRLTLRKKKSRKLSKPNR
jgi:hypothetical protein